MLQKYLKQEQSLKKIKKRDNDAFSRVKNKGDVTGTKEEESSDDSDDDGGYYIVPESIKHVMAKHEPSEKLKGEAEDMISKSDTFVKTSYGKDTTTVGSKDIHQVIHGR